MNGDVTEYLSESELATAIRLTSFQVSDRPGWGEGDFTLSSLAGLTSDEVAHALFQTAIARREETAKWITGALYIRTNAHQSVFRRRNHGWWSYDNQTEYRDGEGLNTTGFVRLVPESRVAGPSPMDPESLKSLTEQYAAGYPWRLAAPGAAESDPLKQPPTGLAGEDILPGHDVRGTAESHERGWYHNCPGCVARRARLQATEGDQTCPGGC